MTQADAMPDSERPIETFAQISLRRGRYLVAIGLGAALLTTLGWALAHPPADLAGVSLTYWGAAAAARAAAGLLVLMLGCVAASMAICRGDAPYVGMWCAFLALGGLAIRGGTIRLMLERAQVAGSARQLYLALAMECLIWLVIVLAAEALARGLWRRYFTAHRWLARFGMPEDESAKLQDLITLREIEPSGISPNVWRDQGLALLVTGGVAYAVLYFWLQSQEKGQVLCGAFVAFALGAMAARWIAPLARPAMLFAAVPLTAAVGYLLADAAVPNPDRIAETRMYPGFGLSTIGRGLPIDYVSFGIAGVVVGYYAAIKARIHHEKTPSTEPTTRA